ncbi:MAG: hypothetical protein ACI88A_004640 [Paraglaciecola sp.]|jgi:hypothetical protein
MKTLLTAVVATIGLSAFNSHAFESKQSIASSEMQHYVFTYNFDKQVVPLTKQFEETHQMFNYALALDIQDQIYSNLNTIVEANNSSLAKRIVRNNSRLGQSE